MFQRILVPLDDDTRTEAALRIASSTARQTGAQLVLMQTEPRAAPIQRVIGARAALQRQITFLRQQGIQAEYAVELGSRAEGVVSAARDRHVDLILLVPVHRQHLDLLWHLRSAVHLLHELPAPLLIWPDGQTFIELLVAREATVMMPLDGALEGGRSLPFALTLAERYHRPLVLLRAVPSGADGRHREVVQGVGRFSDGVQHAQAHLAALREQLTDTTTAPIETAVVAGELGTQLLRAAETYRAGVIVLSAHSHPTMERYFMGGVSTHILRQANVPVSVTE